MSKFFILALIAVFTLLFVGLLFGYFLSAPVYSGPKTHNFDGEKFINPGNKKAKGFTDVLRWLFTREQNIWDEAKNVTARIPTAALTNGAEITFINHSSFLFQFKDVNLITDPIYSNYASPFQFTGPKRMQNVGIEFKDLPAITHIFISHNHYDHLDKTTMLALREKFNPTVICPLGVGKLIALWGFDKIHELDWWDAFRLSSEIDLTATPAQHFSGRGLFDRDKTLWCGFALKTIHHTIYYAGDTGYGDFFKEIGQKFKSFDLAILPIGAYKPEWFMSPIHTSPEEAVKIHKDVNSKQSIAMHFGTFPLADDTPIEAKNKLIKALEESTLPKNVFKILEAGEYIRLTP